MKIYLSGSMASQRRLRASADKLWHMGHQVVGTWLDETARPVDMPPDIFFRQLALKDLTEVKECECIIMDTQDPSTSGGRYVEWGFSLGSGQRLHYLVGPLTGVFDHLADRHFSTWDALLAFFYVAHRRVNRLRATEHFNEGIMMKNTNAPVTKPAGAESELNAGLAVTEAMVLKAVYESGLHQYAPGVLRTSWKDGIDLDVPCPALVNFAMKICKAANPRVSTNMLQRSIN